MGSEERASHLLHAVAHGHYRQVKLYLDAGYNQDCVDSFGNGSTPLTITVTHVRDENVRNRMLVLLLHAGANPNLTDRYGLTPLMHSVLLRQNSSVRLLLDAKKVEFGIEDLEGNTALMHAANLGSTEVVLMILQRLSTVHRMIQLGHKNRNGFTACDLARQSENKELAHLLCWKSSFFVPINIVGLVDSH